MQTNFLTSESSPYLRQHAHQPVAWHPWNTAALEKAKSEGKPIFLSIGYSTCHWCHVMARESFDDEETARLLNSNFVSIKVDREERPDLDKIYQFAHQVITQRAGGWPLTVFLDPENLAPFFAGTYFPPIPRYGMPDFKSLLTNIARTYEQDRSQIAAFTDEVRRRLIETTTHREQDESELSTVVLDEARRQLEMQYDAVNGGFGNAPKFPHPAQLERLLRHWSLLAAQNRSDKTALNMVSHTLEKMAKGGIQDHLGGGFFRYSVDDQWNIPHFEKMLNDNGALLWLYGAAWLVTKKAIFRDAATGVANWMLSEMRDAHGGFFSAQDADSEGVEGKHYAWAHDEPKQHVGNESYPIFAEHFGLDLAPNFENLWHLRIVKDKETLSSQPPRSATDLNDLIDSARSALLKARSARTALARDDKILTAWNGLVIRGLAYVGRIFEHPTWIDAALQSHQFVRKNLWVDGTLFSSITDGRRGPPGFLDDYAFMLVASVELLQARYDDAVLEFVCALADNLIARFEHEKGGFCFTARDQEPPLFRPLSFSDDAMASGNAMAALGLEQLGHLLAHTPYLDAAERTLRAAWTDVSTLPYAHSALLNALELHRYPPQIIILRGSEGEMKKWRLALDAEFSPRRITISITAGGGALPGAGTQIPDNVAIAYRCDNFACSAPLNTLDELFCELQSTR